jgi:DNA-binding transcriptional ArsR family regulator
MSYVPPKTIEIRNKMLKSLKETKSVYDLCAEFKITVSAMKYHLNVLEDLKLIKLHGHKRSPKNVVCFAYIGLADEYTPTASGTKGVRRILPKPVMNGGVSWTTSLSIMA